MGPLGRTPKVWISKFMWDKPETNIEAYVQARLGDGESADSAIRMSETKGFPKGTIQMLIPTWMVRHNILKTSAHCYPNAQDLPFRGAVSFDDWGNYRNRKPA